MESPTEPEPILKSRQGNEKMKDQEIVDFLSECGVCLVCQLRYLKSKASDFSEPLRAFEQLNIQQPKQGEECLSKKRRLDVCPVCLGLFSTEFQAELLKGILATDIDKFECETIVVAISTPMLLQIRQLSMWFALLRKFGHNVDRTNPPDIPVKEAIKLIINPVICDKLGKQYDVNGNGIMINISLTHLQESEEIEKVKLLRKIAFPQGNGKMKEVSRGLLERYFTPAQLKIEHFEQYLPIPPAAPLNPLTLSSISLIGPTVYVAGRYRKISRELSHTPWVLNNVRVMQDSIQEIIIRSVAPAFCKDTSRVMFMSSGREDVDVRCLGKGRPFVLEIPNSHATSLAKSLAHQMEQQIDGSMKVSVRNLQVVQREELIHIKAGEEKKKKFYRALCKLNKPVTLSVMQKLNDMQSFEIQQKTPIRVLHRRPLHTRPRMIYSLRAYVQRGDPRVLVLDVISQAGTYIKELVHGEFGRTAPSIASLIGCPIDILALDVVGIDLDWPKEIDNSTK